MPLWLLERTLAVGYDEYDSLVIRAPSEMDARKLANERYYGFRNGVACERIEEDGETQVIHESFCAG